MKTSHQLARELLAGPDIPVFIATRDAEEPFGFATSSPLNGYDPSYAPPFIEAIELHAQQDTPFSVVG